MKTCSSCKHWRKIRDTDHALTDEITWPGPHGECMVVDDLLIDQQLAWTYASIGPEHIELPVDLSNVSAEASLMTTPDFGCLLHQG